MKGIFLILFIFSTLFFGAVYVEASVPIKILLVPGHDNEVWGAQYGNIKEAAMNLAVATRIYNILKKDKRFDIYITRDSKGYTQEFADYFFKQGDDIAFFIEDAKKEMQEKIKSGGFVEKPNPPHNRASEDVVNRLYGFNKWANENGIDAVIHIHFNDYPRPYKWTIGKHKGFAIYIPDGQFANSKESSLLAANILMELDKKYAVSNYFPEIQGLVPDQKLIAVGANSTLLSSVRSVLIEYAYVYEKKMRNYTTRHQAYNNMAQLTATGIKNYFFPK
jgi:N-acetylmuramoyl-L-alanine amidase